MVAYTKYSENEYCATSKQVDACDVYVIDIPGVKTLLEKYTNKTRPIYMVYFDSNIPNRIDHMVDRGDSDTQIITRLYNDEKEDWLDAIIDIEYYYSSIANRNIGFVVVNANNSLHDVKRRVLEIMEVNNGYRSRH